MRWPQSLFLFSRVAARGAYYFGGSSLPPGATLTRASTGWYFDSAGVLQSAATDVPRFAADGLLVEPARTNGIRNNVAAGAVVGNPGTNPTNWTTGGFPTGISKEIIGFGSINGVNYVDIRYFGTHSGGGASGYLVAFDTTTAIASAQGQTWTESCYIALVGGSLANVTDIKFDQVSYPGGNDNTINPSFHSSVDGTLRRFSGTLTIPQVGNTSIQPRITFFVVNLSTVDFTLRFGLPTMEQASTASTPIKTSGAAVTRAADVLNLALANGTYDIDIVRASGTTNVVGEVIGAGTYTVPTNLSPLQRIDVRRVA